MKSQEKTRETPQRAAGNGPAAGTAVGTIQSLRHGLINLQGTLSTWNDEELAALFSETATLEGAFYAVRCYICRLLAERHSDGSEESGLRAAARILNISYGYARELSAIWGSILSQLKEPPALPQGFFSRALRARQYGVDPAEAIRHAVHIREALGQPYTLRQFENDIRLGLPGGDGSRTRSCTMCAHYVAGAGKLVLIADTGDILAEAETAGVRYCDKFGLLRSGLGDVRVRGQSCPHFQQATGPATTVEERDEAD